MEDGCEAIVGTGGCEGRHAFIGGTLVDSPDRSGFGCMWHSRVYVVVRRRSVHVFEWAAPEGRDVLAAVEGHGLSHTLRRGGPALVFRGPTIAIYERSAPARGQVFIKGRPPHGNCVSYLWGHTANRGYIIDHTVCHQRWAHRLLPKPMTPGDQNTPRVP